jgi:copper oxidase (laccase) domain-containing protein
MMQAAQAAQAQQGQQQPSDPNAAFLQAEQMKVSARVMADQQKAQMDYQKALMQDDRERDKMVQDLAIEAAKILANSGIRLNEQAIKAEQAATQPMGMMGMMPNA